jgi:hypothetical protein
MVPNAIVDWQEIFVYGGKQSVHGPGLGKSIQEKKNKMMNLTDFRNWGNFWVLGGLVV